MLQTLQKRFATRAEGKAGNGEALTAVEVAERKNGKARAKNE